MFQNSSSYTLIKHCWSSIVGRGSLGFGRDLLKPLISLKLIQRCLSIMGKKISTQSNSLIPLKSGLRKSIFPIPEPRKLVKDLLTPNRNQGERKLKRVFLVMERMWRISLKFMSHATTMRIGGSELFSQNGQFTTKLAYKLLISDNINSNSTLVNQKAFCKTHIPQRFYCLGGNS